MTYVPFIIAGGGITGLTLAREFLQRGVPANDLAILESKPFLGEGTSSRNSGVLHAGIYYPPNSQKQKFCLEGNRLWRKLAPELGVQVIDCGKYLVACEEGEIEDLESLYELAKRKEVQGLSWCFGGEISPFVHVKRCAFSRTTGVLDISHAIKAIGDDLLKRDVPIICSSQVDSIEKTREGFLVSSLGEEIHCNYFLNAAGLGAVSLRKKLGLVDIEDYWVKGRYLAYNAPFYSEALIYPVPPKSMKGLGVHTTFDVSGKVRFGPDTKEVERESYEVGEEVVKEMWPSINRLFKGVQKENLVPDYSGIRSKIKKNGELYTDFHIDSPLPGYVEFLGIESPGVTASPAIAKYCWNNWFCS